MLGSAAVSYAALPRDAVDRCRRCAAMSATVSGFKAASRPAATPHYVKACLFSACLQLLATRPQYLPAVEGFVAICGSGSCRSLQADLLNAFDALFSAAASAGQFTSLAPPPRAGLAISRHRSAHARLQHSSSEDSPGSPHSGGSGSGLSAVLRRMKTSLSLRFTSPGQTPGGRLVAEVWGWLSVVCHAGGARGGCSRCCCGCVHLAHLIHGWMTHAPMPSHPTPYLQMCHQRSSARACRPRRSRGRQAARCHLLQRAPLPWARQCRSRLHRWPAGTRQRPGCGIPAPGLPSGALLAG